MPIVKVDLEDVEQPLREKLDNVLLEVSNKLINNIKEEIPKNTGRGSQSFQILSHKENGYILGTPLGYPSVLQFADRIDPWYPPIEPLKRWVRLKLGADESVAYAVQKKIGKEGIEPNKFMDRAIEKLEREFA